MQISVLGDREWDGCVAVDDAAIMMASSPSISTVVMCSQNHFVSQPELPYGLFAIIAEFLAGSHGLGTLANLNVSNHGMYDETLRVLYETVVQDTKRTYECRRILFNDAPLPKRFTFTKCVWVSRLSMYPY
jgi:hypothetical protein